MMSKESGTATVSKHPT